MKKNLFFSLLILGVFGFSSSAFAAFPVSQTDNSSREYPGSTQTWALDANNYDGTVNTLELSVYNTTGSPYTAPTAWNGSNSILLCWNASYFAGCRAYVPSSGSYPVGTSTQTFIPAQTQPAAPDYDPLVMVSGRTYELVMVNTGGAQLFFAGTSVSNATWNPVSGTSMQAPYAVFNPPTPPDPPISDFNEVIAYIPAESFSTSTGSTTIGASFSLVGGNGLEAVGYKLFDPLSGDVLEELFVDYDEGPGIYNVQFEYNFSTTSTYQGRAYFVQDGQEYPNLSGQFIYVDQFNGVGPIEIGPDGHFYFPGGPQATTSTTTLSDLNVMCTGDGWSNSICNAVVALFVPLPTTITSLQGSFQSLMSKSPFNFFYDSYNYIRLLGNAQSVPDTTLTLNLYGNSITLLSTTTVAGIGVDSDMLYDLRDLMAVFLWLGFLIWLFQDIYKFTNNLLRPNATNI